MNITIIGTGCDALRDWGHAKDYVRMQLRWEGEGVDEVAYWTNRPADAVIASPSASSGQAKARQSMPPESMDCHVANAPRNDAGEGRHCERSAAIHEVPVIRVDPCYFRPAAVETLLGDPAKAKQKLGWPPEITAQEMCAEMVAHDLAEAKKCPAQAVWLQRQRQY